MHALNLEITPLILTYNEAPNIRRTLEKLTWAKEILVVDSFSTDETLEIVKSFAQVHIVQRKFDDHTSQWNFGVDQVSMPWVLALDADYVLSENFVEELESLNPGEKLSAYYARFRYCALGQPLRGTLYPPRAVLFRRDRCRYVQDGHTQRLRVEGQFAFLQSAIDHDDRKPLSHWLWAQDRYAALEADHLMPIKANGRKLNLTDRIRKKIIFAPALILFYALFGKGLILDGWPGWFYAFQRTLAEMLLSLKLIEAKLGKKSGVRARAVPQAMVSGQ